MIENTTLTLFDALREEIQHANHIVLSSHREPDGDGLGAICAVASYLESQGKSYTVFSFDPPHPRYSFLQKYHEFSSDPEIFAEADLLIVFDAGDILWANLESIIEKVKRKAVVVNIDHHFSNTRFGDLNIILEAASSTCEIVYYIFKHFEFSYKQEIATALLLGIIIDTGNFSNPATTKESLEVASVLLEKGARYKEILRSIFQNHSKNALHIWGKAFERLYLNKKWKIAVTYLKVDEVHHNGNAEIAAGLSNFFNNLSEVKCSLVLKQSRPGIIRGSLRSTQDGVDVATLAEYLGSGGGHKKAAGFRLRGSLEELENGRVIVI